MCVVIEIFFCSFFFNCETQTLSLVLFLCLFLSAIVGTSTTIRITIILVCIVITLSVIFLCALTFFIRQIRDTLDIIREFKYVSLITAMWLILYFTFMLPFLEFDTVIRNLTLVVTLSVGFFGHGICMLYLPLRWYYHNKQKMGSGKKPVNWWYEPPDTKLHGMYSMSSESPSSASASVPPSPKRAISLSNSNANAETKPKKWNLLRVTEDTDGFEFADFLVVEFAIEAMIGVCEVIVIFNTNTLSLPLTVTHISLTQNLLFLYESMQIKRDLIANGVVTEQEMGVERNYYRIGGEGHVKEGSHRRRRRQ